MQVPYVDEQSNEPKLEGQGFMSELISSGNRSIVEVSGPEARDFLQGIITNDIAKTDGADAIYAGLLTPQGKLLFDFMILKHKDHYLLDVDKSIAADLVKRLMFYKLRANVEITPVDQASVCWTADRSSPETEASISYVDPRSDKAGSRHIFLQSPQNKPCQTTPEKWLAHRIANGLPESPHDFTYGAAFPHDIGMDQLNGIGFQKGCYVGQEVVSRIQHRGTARKRPMILVATDDLPGSPAKVEANGAGVGLLGSSFGRLGLAEIRLDRAEKALNEGKTFTVGTSQVQILKPQWATYGEAFAIYEKQDS